MNAAPSTGAAPLVAHALRTWLHPSETFIHQQVVGGSSVRSLVVARRDHPVRTFDLRGRELWLTTDGLSPARRALADLAYRVRRLTGVEGRLTAARLAQAGVALLHAHFATDAAFFAPVWRRLSVPKVVSFYGYDAVKAPRRLFGYGRRHLAPVLEHFEAFIVPSRDMAQDVSALGAPDERIHVLPWGVALDGFRPALPSERAASGVVRFVSVCRFIGKKGLDDAIAAFARLQRGGIDAELVLAGDGPLRERLARQAQELGVGQRVRFAGFVAAERLPSFLREHDVFVHPSCTPRDGDKEGVPTAILEAAASGLPVVATRHGGIPEAVIDGESGFLVAERDVDALAMRMEELVRDASLRGKMGERGRTHVARNFDATVQASRRERLYFELLGRAPPSLNREK